MAPPTAMLLDGAADMTGSTLAAILIPPAGTICLAAWLALVFYAGRDHPHGPDATLRPAAKALARPRWLPGAPGRRPPGGSGRVAVPAARSGNATGWPAPDQAPPSPPHARPNRRHLDRGRKSCTRCPESRSCGPPRTICWPTSRTNSALRTGLEAIDHAWPRGLPIATVIAACEVDTRASKVHAVKVPARGDHPQAVAVSGLSRID